MIFQKTKISGLYVIDLELKCDERGYFSRIFCEEEFVKIGVDFKVVQASQSFTRKRGTIRGMHFQKYPKAEDKIVRCIKGSVYDIAVDLRSDSLTFGQWFAQELNETNNKMIFIPKGLAHGFQALQDDSIIEYFMSEFYAPDHADGVRWDDPLFKIAWPIADSTLSDRDKNWPLMKK
ncbi:MAG: dTDP-4-dehydrorhamnose 3,5-epimerase [Candidatus Paceibacterota bacterium]|jgi:dTDP-4-dehydrorhamnose 3,5-epimerase